jgi:hypothetical protein
MDIPGKRINRKIVVFESDDWGSIRMPSKEVYNSLLKKGIPVDKLSFNKYDSLESEDDLSALFDVLHSVKDKNGKTAIFTANTIVANPDFDKIMGSGYNNYYYEPFTKTLNRYSNHSNSFQLWKEGINAAVWHPQFHGREHLNVTRWMYALQNDTGLVRLAFKNRMYDLSIDTSISENTFMEALNYSSEEELEYQKKLLIDGLELFENIFGYKSSSFIAPCYIWSSKLHETLKKQGVTILQGSHFQLEPQLGHKHKFRKIFRYYGQVNITGQSNLVRTCYFDPSEVINFDLEGDCLQRIRTAFYWGKPAIISTHRMNYIGFINPTNRAKNLPKLKSLLLQIKKNWPDVEFLTSDQLSDL